MSIDYKIGLTLGGMVTLASLGVSDPQPSAVHYAGIATLGDGTTRGVGWLECEWRWESLYQVELRALRDFCPEPATSATVYIKTLKTGGGTAVYSATMHWPQIEPPASSDCYEDFVLNFVNMVEQGT